MKIFIEGEKYSIEVLEETFESSRFYQQDGTEGTILSVGYYHAYSKQEIVYMLPKVFMKDSDTSIFNTSKDILLHFSPKNLKHQHEYNWIRQISVYFYQSLVEFRNRLKQSSLIQKSLSANLNTNLGTQEYSYLDLLLSFVNFYKKHQSFILFHSVEKQTKRIKKTNWNKTIRKNLPLLNKHKKPIYSQYQNKKNIVDTEEELLSYFFSILYHFNKEHDLKLKISTEEHKIIKGSKFELLQQNGFSKLKKIKYKYFNDTLRKMYHLCEIYFSHAQKSSLLRKREEFISINNYNIVFEDMIDKLLSESFEQEEASKPSLKELKYNHDGKIIDHVFNYQSLIDRSNIFYIGDSKYYKSDNLAGKISTYKQFTYAKNVIQYNIDLLNEGRYYTSNTRYRDEVTEGYNISPNFFIYGYIEDYTDFDNPQLKEKGNIIRSYHFEDRLFDRDTLFVHQYQINFLYVLKAYCQNNKTIIQDFRNSTRARIRNNFIDYFSNKSSFKLYIYKGNNQGNFIAQNFRQINGKCFITKENKLILAVHKNDKSMQNLLNEFEEFSL